MIAFDRRIQSMQAEGMIGGVIDLQFFSPVYRIGNMRDRFVRLYSYVLSREEVFDRT